MRRRAGRVVLTVMAWGASSSAKTPPLGFTLTKPALDRLGPAAERCMGGLAGGCVGDADVLAFRDLVRDAPLAVLVHVDGIVVYANRCAQDILGVPPAGGRGLRLADLVHPEDVDRVRHRSQQAIERHVAPGS